MTTPSKGKKFISISGNPPAPGITAQKQRDEFADQLCTQLHLLMKSDPLFFFASMQQAGPLLYLFFKGNITASKS